MDYLLVIYICSAIDHKCIIPDTDPYIYPKTQSSHASCVKHGLGESFDLLYGEKYFTLDMINQMQLYPKFTCKKTETEDEGSPT
jgi:hypothetical protein